MSLFNRHKHVFVLVGIHSVPPANVNAELPSQVDGFDRCRRAEFALTGYTVLTKQCGCTEVETEVVEGIANGLRTVAP